MREVGVCWARAAEIVELVATGKLVGDLDLCGDIGGGGVRGAILGAAYRKPTLPMSSPASPSLLAGLGFLALTTSLATGAITLTGDSSTFAYQYEMDVNPSGQDLDGAGSASDWFSGTAGGSIIPQVYVGGVAFSDQAPAVGSPQNLFRTDFGGSIQRQSLVGGDFTMELRLRFLGPVDGGDVGGFGLAMDPGGASSAFRMNVSTSEVNLDSNGNSAVATGSNGDVMHTFRIAYDLSEDRYWAWRDDVLLYGTDLATGMVGTNPQFNDNGSFFLGDFTGSLSGDWEVDYIRLDDSAVAPVPEPSVALLGGMAGLFLLRRRR